MSTQQTFLQVSYSQSANSIDGHASSQRSVNMLVTKYEDVIHFIASHVSGGTKMHDHIDIMEIFKIVC